VDINLVRDKSSGKFKGYGFLCYEDQRSTILAVDNLNGIKVQLVSVNSNKTGTITRPPSLKPKLISASILKEISF
jgi:RNA recognition motif-containing protein